MTDLIKVEWVRAAWVKSIDLAADLLTKSVSKTVLGRLVDKFMSKWQSITCKKGVFVIYDIFYLYCLCALLSPVYYVVYICVHGCMFKRVFMRAWLTVQDTLAVGQASRFFKVLHPPAHTQSTHQKD